MIAHTTLHVSDYKKAKEFYTTVLATLGYTNNMSFDDDGAAGFSDGDNTDFWLHQGDVVPTHVAFVAKNKNEVEDFYDTALANGAKNNGGPGYRKEYWPGYYAAFVHDLDGHNIEAVFYDPDEK